MKRFHLFITISILILTAACLVLFTGCKKDEEGGATASPTAPVKTSSPTAAATPETTPGSATAPATEAPKEKNLLYYAIDDDPSLLGGDSWVPLEGQWAGPLNEKRDCEDFAKQEFVEATLSDGTEGICYHFFSDSTTGYHVNGNTFGIMDLLEKNKTYKLTVTLKYTVPKPGDPRDCMGLGCNIGGTPVMKIKASEEWQTITYTFKTGTDLENAFIYISPYGAVMDAGMIVGEILAGFDLLVSEITLVEVQ